MSALRIKDVWMTPEEYLEWQQRQEVRYEYLAGEIHMMEGATVAHNYIEGNIFGELYSHLRGKKCAPFMNDMKAHIEDAGDHWFYYPDVMVSDPTDQHALYCDTPSVIFEVLSPSTEQTDRREKRLAYERLPSLHTYILVAQELREVTVYRRRDGLWHKSILPATGSTLEIPELEFSISLDAIYARTGL
jgi:Uma2 family endonuclease